MALPTELLRPAHSIFIPPGPADDTRVDVKVGLYRKGQSESWLEGADWVVDAIDNIDTKVDLLTHCHQNAIPVFSSMGSGAKRDPTRVQIA